MLGDVQGHGTVAAMAMMAVQGFLRQLSRLEGLRELGPADVANALQGFVASNLGAVSYLTALVCFHRPAEGVVDWIGCGAPDPAVVDPDDPAPRDINPERRGGLPVGLLPDTVYTAADAVRTPLLRFALPRFPKAGGARPFVLSSFRPWVDPADDRGAHSPQSASTTTGPKDKTTKGLAPFPEGLRGGDRPGSDAVCRPRAADVARGSEAPASGPPSATFAFFIARARGGAVEYAHNGRTMP